MTKYYYSDLTIRKVPIVEQLEYFVTALVPGLTPTQQTAGLCTPLTIWILTMSWTSSPPGPRTVRMIWTGEATERRGVTIAEEARLVLGRIVNVDRIPNVFSGFKKALNIEYQIDILMF